MLRLGVVILALFCVLFFAYTSISSKSFVRALMTKTDVDRFVELAMTENEYTSTAIDNTLAGNYEKFVQALASRADTDRFIILAMTDESFVDMAINFYESSLRTHHIDNFLFVGVGRKTCQLMTNIPCFYYTDDPSQGKPSLYLSKDFIRKMNIRTEMILEALAANFTVIHADTDIVFLSNPLTEIKVIRPICPIAIA